MRQRMHESGSTTVHIVPKIGRGEAMRDLKGVRLVLLYGLGGCALCTFCVLAASLAYTCVERMEAARHRVPSTWRMDISSNGVWQGKQLQPMTPVNFTVYEEKARRLQESRHTHPVRLKYPIVWQSAFWSHSGACQGGMAVRKPARTLTCQCSTLHTVLR